MADLVQEEMMRRMLEHQARMRAEAERQRALPGWTSGGSPGAPSGGYLDAMRNRDDLMRIARGGARMDALAAGPDSDISWNQREQDIQRRFAPPPPLRQDDPFAAMRAGAAAAQPSAAPTPAPTFSLPEGFVGTPALTGPAVQTPGQLYGVNPPEWFGAG